MNKLISVLCIVIALFSVSCGSAPKTLQRPIPPKTEAEKTFLDLYIEGQRFYDNGNLDDAENSILIGIEKNPEYMPLYELLGHIYFAQSFYEKAESNYSKVLSINAYSIPSRIGLGRIYLKEMNYILAKEQFDTVIEIKDDNAEAYFYTGMIYQETRQGFLAKISFIKAIKADNSFRQTIDGIINLTDEKTAKMFHNNYLNLPARPELSRGELAALIFAVFTNDRVFENKSDNPAFSTPQMISTEQSLEISDVPDNHWAVHEITSIVKSGLLDLFPDNSFKPDTKIINADFASIIQKIFFRLTNDNSIFTKYIGESSPYLDLNDSHWAYSAVRLSVLKGIIEPKSSNVYGIRDYISGLTAVKALTKLNNSYSK